MRSRGAFADAFLFTPVVRAGTNEALSCTAINVGSKPIPQVVVALVAYPPSNTGLGTATCPELAPANTSTFGGVCSRGYSGPVEVFCRIQVTGASKNAVRAVLSVWDANGGAMNTVEAR
jgi:hypothetical protein